MLPRLCISNLSDPVFLQYLLYLRRYALKHICESEVRRMSPVCSSYMLIAEEIFRCDEIDMAVCLHPLTHLLRCSLLLRRLEGFPVGVEVSGLASFRLQEDHRNIRVSCAYYVHKLIETSVYILCRRIGESVEYECVKVADLSAEEMKSAYATYEPSYTAATNKKDGKYILYEGEYIDFNQYKEKTGKGVIDWDMISEKYKVEYYLADGGRYVQTSKGYALKSTLSENELSALVKTYNLVWDSQSPGTHMYYNGEYVSIAGLSDEEVIELIPKYNSNMMMYKRTGAGGKNLTVRVLYYNYYQYKNGMEPVFVFGADSQGYDILVRLAQGARLSFLLAVVVAVINLIIGIFYGSIQGYYGGKLDMFMEYFSEILAGVPTIILVTLFRMHFVDTGKISQLGALILAFIATGWIGSAYSVRMQFYRFKGQEYVLAARTLGASDFRLITKHIFPNAVGTLVTSWAFVIPGIIFSETTYSYLGIINFNGTTMTSLGTMLSNGQAAGIDRFPHIIFFPALVLSLLMICFNLFGNGLRDAFNPSLRGSEG